MELSGEHPYPAPPAAVFAALLDPAALRAAIPGCEHLEEFAPGVFAITARLRIGPLRGTHSATVTITDQTPPHGFALAVHGSGRPGSLRAPVTVALRETAPGITLVTCHAVIHTTGPLARLGRPLLAASARTLLQRFFRNMEAQVAARLP